MVEIPTSPPPLALLRQTLYFQGDRPGVSINRFSARGTNFTKKGEIFMAPESREKLPSKKTTGVGEEGRGSAWGDRGTEGTPRER